ncbi:hypothetical protein [Streptosporangium carneum]|uniref:Uncharacterized protein n=1 Tax=Streptosporangium carneum TaxID=47481 RepID=A0A9W6MCF2_9ACTN|nr:hypothetical protein [Streptosporangium carneum]GLK08683.1 hypothetical protein GCM10017600_20880 [Streptosporangium carneum]
MATGDLVLLAVVLFLPTLSAVINVVHWWRHRHDLRPRAAVKELRRQEARAEAERGLRTNSYQHKPWL